MQKGYLGIGIGSVLWILPLLMQAQGGPNAAVPEKNTKTVRACVYEVVPGLAEITKLEIDKTADESLLHYNEHKVLFKFTPMGDAELLPCLKEHELEFTLRSNVTKIPVGPQYVQQKGIKVGTKYAMNILQTKDKKACLEQYTYESKALDNDLFEVKAQIIPFVKGSYYTALPMNEVGKLEACLSTEEVVETISVQALGLNEDSLRTVIRTELEAKYKKPNTKLKNKQESANNYVSKGRAFKKARKIAKEKARQDKLEKQEQLLKEKERRMQLKELRTRLEQEIELEITEKQQ